MALANCSRCGSLFNKVTRDICNECHQEEEELLRETQNYLRDNRQAQIWELVDNVEGVEQWLIEKWVKEERIHVYDPEQEASKKRCQYCGREVIGAGTVCKTCEVKKTIASKGKKPSAEDQLLKKDESDKAARSGMHFKRR